MAVAFGAGWTMRSGPAAKAQIDNFALLDEVQDLLAEHYVRELPPATELEYAAIRGYLSALNDPFTFFIDPPVTRSESDALAGRYGGIGVEVIRDETGLVLLFPYPDSPAARAGIRDGDILLDINGGQLQAGERLDIIRQMLRGEIVEGEENGVTVTVIQADETEARTYSILFEEIRVPSVIWRVLAEDSQIGYAQIKSFTALTPEEFEEAVTDLADQDVGALVLDLRNNAGGLLQESIDVAEMFLNDGIIVREENRNGETIREAQTANIVPDDWPIFVLVNSSTASASEVVAGALQANERGVLVGQQTRGKGSVQFIFALSDGSSIHITASIWKTPTGDPIDGVGLTPDIAMIPDENGRDVEVGEAIRRIQMMRTADNSTLE
jgi:carboxyl-terminal processing protease